VRLRPLTEAEAYARCYGEGDDNVRSVKIQRRPRYELRVSGEDLRQAFEQRLEKREPDESEPPGEVPAVSGGEPAAAA
jgi:hypothetical protein